MALMQFNFSSECLQGSTNIMVIMPERPRAVSAEDYERYMRDPVHPTKLGYTEWWGPRFVSVLNKIL